MLEKVFEVIHAERKMSLNNWRYRLLHWTFATDPDRLWRDANGCVHSPLPNYLYTHYCPLFHLTNLIALLSPAILLIKLLWACGVVGVYVAKKIIAGIQKGITVYQALRPQPKPEADTESDAEILKKHKEKVHNKELHSIPGLLVKLAKWDTCYLTHFDCFFDKITDVCYIDRIWLLSKEEVKKIWDETAPKITAALEAQKARKEKMRNRILFWVNFSRVFIKGVLNLFYLTLFAGVLYITYLYGWPCCKIIGSAAVWAVVALLSLDWLGCLIGLGRFLLGVAIGIATIGGISWLLYKFVPLNIIWQKTCPPFIAVNDAFLAICRYIKNIVVGTCEFITLFYEENCPPITIIDETESAITEEIE